MPSEPRPKLLNAPNYWSPVALAATSLFVLVLSAGWWNGLPPLGDDASGHITVFARFAEALHTHSGLWAPDYNLGFPIGLYYQPLPHAVGGSLTAVFGGGAVAIAVYKFITIALLCATPWAFFLGCRRLGFGLVGSTAAGVASVLIRSELNFGLTAHSSLVLGLHAQAWAGVALPIAAGEVGRLVSGRSRSLAPAVLAWSFLMTCHFFYGIGLGALALVWCVTRSPRRSAKNFLTLGGASIAVVASLLFWFVPLLGSLPAMGGWPFGSAERVDGYGFAGFLGPLLRGQLLDGSGKVPIFTLLFAAGLTIALMRLKRDRRAWFLVTGVGLTVAFCIGRAGLGWVVDIFPLNRVVQMFRYLGMFHLVAIATIGFAVGELVAILERNRWLRVAVVVGGMMSIGVAGQGGAEFVNGFRTIDKAGLNYEEYQGLVDEMRSATRSFGAGRTYAFPRTGLSGHYYSGLLGLWDAGDMGESRGAGLHDSLNYYFLEFFHPERLEGSTLIDLYGFQYLAGSRNRSFEDAGLETSFISDDYAYWRVPHRVSGCLVANVDKEISAFPRETREDARLWLRSSAPADGSFPLVRVPDRISTGGVTAGVVRVEGEYEPSQPRRVGEVVLSQRASDRNVCRVDMQTDGLVVFKNSYHNYWQITVDGQPASTLMTYPGFVAALVPAGSHDVVARFARPKVSIWLFPLCWAIPTLLGFWRLKQPKDRTQTQETRA